MFQYGWAVRHGWVVNGFSSMTLTLFHLSPVPNQTTTLVAKTKEAILMANSSVSISGSVELCNINKNGAVNGIPCLSLKYYSRTSTARTPLEP